MLYNPIKDATNHAPFVERMIAQRMMERAGVKRKKDIEETLTALAESRLAREFSKDGEIQTITPKPGATIGWIEGDVLLTNAFSRHLGKMRDKGVSAHNGITFTTVARDIGSSIDTADTYLAMGREKRKIGAIIDHFLDAHSVRFFAVTDLNIADLERAIAENPGQFVISGPYDKTSEGQ